MEGPTSIGYGDDDDATVIEKTSTLYIRKTFLLDKIDTIIMTLFHIDYDDAFVAYLNGAEFARANIGTVGIRPRYDEKADRSTEAKIFKGNPPELYELRGLQSLLKNGTNVLSIQIHSQETGTLRDMTVIPFLTFGFNETPESPSGTGELIEPPSYNLHTNFKLNNEREKLVLIRPNHQIADSITYKNMRLDISQGRRPDGSTHWISFSNPTPGEANDTTFSGNLMADPPTFSLPGGLYQHNINLILSTAANDVIIRYTLDCSTPSDTSIQYSNPIHIDVNQPTVVKARTYKAGLLPSAVITHSYLHKDQNNHPLISISTDPINLWDYNHGIYVMGPNADSQNPYFNANFWQDWEKPIHFEFYEPDGNAGFCLDAGIRIYGAWSRAHAQKSFAIFARRRYGTSTIHYQIFPDEPINEFSSFILRNSGNDWSYTLFRDAMMQRLVKSLELGDQAYRPAIVYLNGEYWGIYNIREKLNEDYLASHYGIDPNNVDILESDSGVGDGIVLEGDDIHYRNMLNYIDAHNLSNTNSYEYIKTQMDVENFMEYSVAEIYFDNKNWPQSNMKYWREKTANGKWRWLLYDTDFGFGLYNPSNYSFNTLEYATTITDSRPWPTFLLRNLLTNQQFTNAFINLCADYLNTIFHPDTVIQTIDEMEAFIENEMQNHLDRWNTRIITGWQKEVETLREFASFRIEHMRNHVLEKLNLSGTADVTLILSHGQAGKIQINTQHIRQFPWNGVYFKDVPIRITALANPGYRFVHWSGDQNTEESTISIQLDGNLSLTAVFEAFEQTSGTVVINEINYNSADYFNTKDWIELVNDSDEVVDMTNWRLNDSNPKNWFTFPSGIMMEPTSYLVLVQDTSSFQLFFPHVDNYIGEFNFGLNSEKETLRLIDNRGTIVDSLTYVNEAPWPVLPDGGGSTLALKDPSLDNSLSENWASSAGHGSPGSKNDITASVDNKTYHSQSPNTFVLEQNYPNPFNAMTTISYLLPHNAFVTLKIYNLQGAEVDILFHGKQEVGHHNFIFNACHLSSGVYLYRLQAGHFIETRKMIVIK